MIVMDCSVQTRKVATFFSPEPDFTFKSRPEEIKPEIPISAIFLPDIGGCLEIENLLVLAKTDSTEQHSSTGQ